MRQTRISRRKFLKCATGTAVGAIGFPYLVSSSALGKADSVAASNRILVGCVGVGPQGSGVMRNFLGQKDAQVVAICDLKKQARDAAQNLVNQSYQNNDCKT
ncbi:MAG TPA: twin-arginine translocation signal domain-containing protein, partial [Sedimentisphaerales bacterium]|nr:twin-arginine translocation signal domain-containing protein [Sedimentisphaerales bacterium]